MISSIRMHNFKFTKKTINDENAINDDTKNADRFSSPKVRKEEGDEGEGENCAEENNTSWSHCSLTNLWRKILI